MWSSACENHTSKTDTQKVSQGTKLEKKATEDTHKYKQEPHNKHAVQQGDTQAKSHTGTPVLVEKHWRSITCTRRYNICACA